MSYNFYLIFSPKQGHLTRFLSYGLGLKVTTIEADVTLVKMASKFDRELEWTLEKEQKKVLDLLFHKFLKEIQRK